METINNYGHNVLHIAINNKQIELLKWLLNHIPVDKTALHMAKMTNDKKLYNWILNIFNKTPISIPNHFMNLKISDLYDIILHNKELQEKLKKAEQTIINLQKSSQTPSNNITNKLP